MSSPITLKRDMSTFTYLANKRQIHGLSLHMLQKTWELHKPSYARRATILKLVTGWNVNGSRYALYTQDPQAKLINARCLLCLAPDSDLHWICECPCPTLKEPRDTFIQETIPTHLRYILTHTEQHQAHLLPQLSDLCQALRTGLTNSPHREYLWKGAWTTNQLYRNPAYPLLAEDIMPAIHQHGQNRTPPAPTPLHHAYRPTSAPQPTPSNINAHHQTTPRTGPPTYCRLHHLCGRWLGN